MPLLSFEGVEVDIPTTLEGIQFAFTNGALTIRCANFTGNIALGKPLAAPVPVTTPSEVEITSTALTDFPSTTTGTEPLVIQTSKKRGSTDLLDSDESESDSLLAAPKRPRPNFLNDVEQTMLLAQLEASQQSLLASNAEVDSLVASSTAASPEKEPEAPVVEAKTPAKSPAPTKKSAKKSFFSPDPKELATKKATPDSAKRARGPKAKSDGAQISIRDMMLQAAPGRSTTTTPPPVSDVTDAEWGTVETVGNVPKERWGHTVTRISGDRLVVYGGADDDEATLGDVHVYDLRRREWSQPLNCESVPRTWHDAVYLESKHLVLVFGGERAMGDDHMDVLSDIMVLDTECFLWYPPAISGIPPIARSGHTCTVLGTDVIVFGGSRGRSRQSSVHVLDTDSWHWKTIKISGKAPSARTYHSAVAMGSDSVVFFGGNDSKKSFNSVHVLRKGADAWSWFHPCVVGAPPRARTGHSATRLSDSQILVFGGWDPQSGGGDGTAAATVVFEDAFILDTTSWEWQEVAVRACSTVGGGERGRVGHVAVLVDSDGDHHPGKGDEGPSILVFGGQDGSERRLSTVHSLRLTASRSSSSSSSSSGDGVLLS